MTRTYSELIQIPTFEGRFNYLSLKSHIGATTFGAERYLNQSFYRGSREWLEARDKAIIRDSYNGLVCNLGHPDRPIYGAVIVHHINPITIEDIENQSSILFNLENLICTDDLTHKALHYGNFESLPKDYIPRKPNDTCPWKI